jgi:hypothetical protein
VVSLTWEQVTAWRLSRNHLIRRAGAAKLVTAVREMCGAHAQIMSSVAMALGARLNKFDQVRLDTALEDDRTLVKTWAMRGTLHIFPADDISLYCAAQQTRDQYMNAAFLRYMDLELADVHAVLDAIPAALDGRILSRDELTNEILRITKRRHLEPRLRSGWGEMLKPAAFRGLLCFGPKDGRTSTFVRPDQWIGAWTKFDSDVALQEVYRRFLSAYAPASRAEIARWWGVRPPEAGRVLKLLAGELEEVELNGTKRWVLRTDLRSLKSKRSVTGVRLLPSFDQILVMSAPHSEAIVDDDHAGGIYRPRTAVWSLPAVLVDGRVRAAWKLERKTKRALVTIEPFGKLTRTTMSELESEVERLGTVIDMPTELRSSPP